MVVDMVYLHEIVFIVWLMYSLERGESDGADSDVRLVSIDTG